MYKITLQQWNERYFVRPRSARTLYHYIQNGLIYPAPVKKGREYEIDNNAILLDKNSIENTGALMKRIQDGRKTQKGKYRATT